MKMNDAFLMRLDDIFRQQHPAREIFGDLARHVIALCGIDRRILVGILLVDFLIDLIDQRQDPVVRRVGLACDLPLVTVADILLRNLIAAHLHDALLYHILDLFDACRMRHGPDLTCDLIRDRHDLIFI